MLFRSACNSRCKKKVDMHPALAQYGKNPWEFCYLIHLFTSVTNVTMRVLGGNPVTAAIYPIIQFSSGVATIKPQSGNIHVNNPKKANYYGLKNYNTPACSPSLMSTESAARRLCIAPPKIAGRSDSMFSSLDLLLGSLALLC